MAEKADVIVRIEPRESGSWPGTSPRPDTLKQTEQRQMKLPLLDRAGYTFDWRAGRSAG
jgi:hypothetical protein